MLAAMMRQSISVRHVTGRDRYGHVDTVTLGPFRCLIEGKNTRVRNASGEEVVSSMTVYCAEHNAEIVAGDVALVPVYDDNGEPTGDTVEDEIIAVGTFFTSGGPRYSVWSLK